MKSASGEARNTAALAISSGLPGLPAGIEDMVSFLALSSLSNSNVIGVSITPGKYH